MKGMQKSLMLISDAFAEKLRLTHQIQGIYVRIGDMATYGRNKTMKRKVTLGKEYCETIKGYYKFYPKDS